MSKELEVLEGEVVEEAVLEQPSLTLTAVLNFLERGREEGFEESYQQAMLEIENTDMVDSEYIIFAISDLDYKINFLRGAYNEDLTHKNTDKIKIRNVVFVSNLFG